MEEVRIVFIHQIEQADSIKGNKKKYKKKYFFLRRNLYIPYIFILPFFITYGVFGIFPILYALRLSFFSWDGIVAPKFIGITNYIDLLKDPLVLKSFTNNVILLLMSTPIGLVIALIIAFILEQILKKYQNIFEGIFFTPMVTSSVAIGLIFMTLYGTRYGLINSFLHMIGIKKPILWLTDPMWMKIGLAILLLWRWIGWDSLLFTAGLQSISNEIYEAAKVDGANRVQLFYLITIPLLKPTIVYLTIVSIIGMMQLFEEPYVLVPPEGPIGGYGHSLLTMNMYLYFNAFRYFKFGYASAFSYLIFIIIFMFSFVSLKVMERTH